MESGTAVMRRHTLALLLIFIISGCGSSTGGTVTTSSISGGETLDFRLEQGMLPAEVSQVELDGLDANGKVVWELAAFRGDSFRFEGLPTGATRMVVKYLADRQVVGLSLVDLGPQTGESEAIRGRTVGNPEFLTLAQAVESVSMSNTDIEMPVTTILLIKLPAVLANGSDFDLRKQAAWISTDPTVARVENGLVTAHALGTTTIVARIADHTVRTDLQVVPIPDGIPQSVTFENNFSDVVVDADEGTVNGSTIPGWNAKNKTVVVGRATFGTNCRITGDDLVLSAVASGNNDTGEIDLGIPGSPGKVTNLHLYSATSMEMNFLNRASDQQDGSFKGGDVTLISDGTFSVGNELSSDGIGNGRGGDLTLRGNGESMSLAAVSSDGFIGGDVSILGNTINYNFGDLTATPSGRVTLVGETQIAVDDSNQISVAGGPRGGQISLASPMGTIQCDGDLDASGGDADTTSSTTGGMGGTIRVFSSNNATLAKVDVSGGDGSSGAGGDGGTIIVTSASADSFVVSGGEGASGGADGRMAQVADDGQGYVLNVAAGQELTFDSLSGALTDGSVDFPGWDPIARRLTLGGFKIESGGTLQISGRGLLTLLSVGVSDIGGTLSLTGRDQTESSTPANGGSIQIVSNSLIALETSGSIESNGGNGNDLAGVGGIIALTAPTLQVSGPISIVGGDAPNGESRDGGVCALSGTQSVTVSGNIDCSGQDGFGGAGSGGLLSLVSAGSLDTLGQLISKGGDSGSSPGDGGLVQVVVAGLTSLGQVVIDGGDSTLRPGTGGTLDLEGTDPITINGRISANSGQSDTGKAGTGGTVEINGSSTVTLLETINANGTPRGQGGTITVHGDDGVTVNGALNASPRGTVTVTP